MLLIPTERWVAHLASTADRANTIGGNGGTLIFSLVTGSDLTALRMFPCSTSTYRYYKLKPNLNKLFPCKLCMLFGVTLLIWSLFLGKRQCLRRFVPQRPNRSTVFYITMHPFIT
jgi:hypothetical protein